jgi:hypothetical protein
MSMTPFPENPCDVAPLTVTEFTSDLDLSTTVSIDVICRCFLDDANRALVWRIRFRALTSWCGRSDMSAWLRQSAPRTQHACEAAASFELNGQWEFEAESFRCAVESRALPH